MRDKACRLHRGLWGSWKTSNSNWMDSNAFLDIRQVGELTKASDLDEACLGCRPLHVATQARGLSWNPSSRWCYVFSFCLGCLEFRHTSTKCRTWNSCRYVALLEKHPGLHVQRWCGLLHDGASVAARGRGHVQRRAADCCLNDLLFDVADGLSIARRPLQFAILLSRRIAYCCIPYSI